MYMLKAEIDAHEMNCRGHRLLNTYLFIKLLRSFVHYLDHCLERVEHKQIPSLFSVHCPRALKLVPDRWGAELSKSEIHSAVFVSPSDSPVMQQ